MPARSDWTASRCTSARRSRRASAGIETVYQNLALSPALSIADNMFLGRERRKPGFARAMSSALLDRAAMRREAREQLNALGLLTIQNIRQPVETLSGGQRQGVAVVRATAFGSRVIIMDEPTAALGVKESRKVLELMLDVKKRGLPIILISHNMPHVFEVADRIHIHRLGRRIAVDRPEEVLDVRRGRDHDRRDEAAAGRSRGGLGEKGPGAPDAPLVHKTEICLRQPLCA